MLCLIRIFLLKRKEINFDLDVLLNNRLIFQYFYNRFVNDSPSKFANAVVKRHLINNKVFVIMNALCDIEENTELR